MFWVTDTGNRRVLGWRGPGLPDPTRPADVLLGQDDADQREDNRGEGVGAAHSDGRTPSRAMVGPSSWPMPATIAS